MSRRAAAITEADVRRIIRAAKREHAHSVEVYVGETRVVIRLKSSAAEATDLELHEAPVL